MEILKLFVVRLWVFFLFSIGHNKRQITEFTSATFTNSKGIKKLLLFLILSHLSLAHINDWSVGKGWGVRENRTRVTAIHVLNSNLYINSGKVFPSLIFASPLIIYPNQNKNISNKLILVSLKGICAYEVQFAFS